MFLEAIQPVALLLSILSVYAVFHTAFLLPTTLHDRILDSLLLLALSAAISTVSGLLFRESTHPAEPLAATLPVRIFLWSATIMALLFVASWYLETYCIFYKDIRRF